MCGFVDLDTGEPIWMGKARDDVEWQWIYAQRDIGEIALGNLMAQLGFQEANRHGKNDAVRRMAFAGGIRAVAHFAKSAGGRV